MIERTLRVISRLVVARPGVVLGATLALTLAAAALLPRFRIDPDVASLFPADHPSIELLRATEAGQRGSRTLFVVIKDAELERVLPLVKSALEASPQLVEVVATRAAFAGDALRRAPLYFLAGELVDQLERRLADDSERLAAVRRSEELLADPFAGSELVQRDPLGLRWILASALSAALPPVFDPDSSYLKLVDGSLALLRVVGARDPFDIDFSRELLQDLETRLEELELDDFDLIGGYAIARSDAARIRSDLERSLWFSIPLILLFLIISTRSLTLPCVLMLPVALAILWALAFGGALLGPLTPLSISAAAIMIGLGVDFTIHYARRFRVEREAHAIDDAIERTTAGTGRALFAGLTTTLAAFLCFGIGSFHGLRTFGFLLALGLTFAFVATMFLLPILLARGERWKRVQRAEPASLVIGVARAIQASRAARPIAFGILATALVGWVVVGARGLIFDADPARMRPATSPLKTAAAELEAALGMSPVAITVLTPSATRLEALQHATETLRTNGVIAFALGAQALVPSETRRARVRTFRDATAGWVEAACRDLERVGFRPEPFRSGLDAQAELFAADPSVDAKDHRLTWRGNEYWITSLYPTRSLTDQRERRAFHAAVESAFAGEALIVDPFGLSDELGPLLRADLARAAVWCVLAILVFVRLNAGSVRLALATLVPVFSGLGIVLGAVAWLGVPLHPGNFIAIPLILGLGVDDGIHMVLRYRAGERDVLGTTGTAVWRTTATTALGFGSLCSVSTPVIASMGAIVLAGVLCCFAASVLVLPVLFRTPDAKLD